MIIKLTSEVFVNIDMHRKCPKKVNIFVRLIQKYSGFDNI